MTSTEESRQAAVLDEFVQDAARQRLYLQGWERDRELLESSGRIIYSIDTDTLKLFLDPVDMAASRPATGRRPRPGYTQIFRRDPPELSIALGKAIAEFIFFRLGERFPILMLPPLEREVGAVFQAITTQADQEHRDALAELDRLRKNVTGFVERIQSESDDAGRLNLVVAEMPNLHELLFGYSGPSAELARFAILLERSDLTDFASFLSRPHDVHADVVGHLRLLNTIRGWIEFSHLQGRWEERIERSKSKWIHRKNIEADCQALARLEQLNRILNPFKVRVVHVTGDRAIFEAASTYQPHDDDQSFASLYLRHPRAFLAEPSVLFTESDEDSRKAKELIPWLDVFLARFTGATAPSSIELLELLEQTAEERRASVQQVLEGDPDAGRVFEEEWNQFCGPITLDHVLSASGENSSQFEQYLSILRGWADGLGKDDKRSFREAAEAFEDWTREFERILDELEEAVAERVMETWQDCFAAATSTGFSLLRFGPGPKSPARSPLPITFATLQAASDFFSKMLHGGTGEGYREMINTVWSEDDSGYLFYLAFGALFGAQGKWRIASILADRALGVVAELGLNRQAPGKVNGREAYYLRAAARRLTARAPDDLKEAQSDLQQARDALERSRADNPEYPITPLRFDAEQTALDLSRHLFNLFSESASEREPSLEPLELLQMNIRELLERIDQELPEPRMQERVRRALLVNYLMCLFLRARSPPGTLHAVEIREHDRPVFDELSRRMEGGEGMAIEQSYLHRAVLLTARALLDPPETTKDLRKLRSELREYFEDSAISANLVTTYDRRRFEFMRDLARRTLDEQFRQGRSPTSS